MHTKHCKNKHEHYCMVAGLPTDGLTVAALMKILDDLWIPHDVARIELEYEWDYGETPERTAEVVIEYPKSYCQNCIKIAAAKVRHGNVED